MNGCCMWSVSQVLENLKRWSHLLALAWRMVGLPLGVRRAVRVGVWQGGRSKVSGYCLMASQFFAVHAACGSSE